MTVPFPLSLVDSETETLTACPRSHGYTLMPRRTWAPPGNEENSTLFHFNTRQDTKQLLGLPLNDTHGLLPFAPPRIISLWLICASFSFPLSRSQRCVGIPASRTGGMLVVEEGILFPFFRGSPERRRLEFLTLIRIELSIELSKSIPMAVLSTPMLTNFGNLASSPVTSTGNNDNCIVTKHPGIMTMLNMGQKLGIVK